MLALARWQSMRGDMSLVGPRPCLPTQIALIDARQKSGAFNVRPGITGLAQVRGIDMSLPEELAEIDGHYARTRTLRGDVTILIQTLSGRGLRQDPMSRRFQLSPRFSSPVQQDTSDAVAQAS